MKRLLVGVLSVLTALAATSAAYGLINPNFTPIDLIDQSELIVLLKFKGEAKDGKITADIVKVFRGTSEAKTIVFDLSTSPVEDDIKKVNELIKEWGREPILFFVGGFEEEGPETPEAEEDETKAHLHIGSMWITFFSAEGSSFELFKAENSDMHGTWHGGPDMFLRCLRYLLSNDDADVPTRTEAEWDFLATAGKVEGKVCAVRAVDLTGDGTTHLFVGCDKGDRLFLFDKKEKKFKDVTASMKLSSKSTEAVWGDFNGDGRLDLLSWDGKAFAAHLRGNKGTFKVHELALADASKDGCLGMAVVDCGKNGLPAVVVGTNASPVLLTPDGTGSMTPRKLVEGALPGKDLGNVGRCLVADFNGDAIPDIIQPYENGGLFYKGKSPAVFDAPTAVPVALGKGRSDACLGDFDADGRTDILCVAEDFPRLWHNYAPMKFVEVFDSTGEPSYIAEPDGVGCATGDINNDGRQDFLITYAGRHPHLFFNRGFRSFGHSHMMDVAERNLLDDDQLGQQAGHLADFNGDGAQDMAIVLLTGDIVVVFRQTAGALVLRVALPLTGVSAGPVAVTGWAGERCLGAWNVVAGTRDAFLGLFDAGPVTVTWRLPGGKEQKREIIVADKPVRFVIK